MSVSFSTLWVITFIMAIGGVGGLVNSLLSDNLFFFIKNESGPDGTVIHRYGLLVNVVIGAVAALISWGSAAEGIFVIISPNSANKDATLSVTALVAALVIGIGGARWLTGEVDKRLFKTAASLAAEGQSDKQAAMSILVATPTKALEIAKQLSGGGNIPPDDGGTSLVQDLTPTPSTQG